MILNKSGPGDGTMPSLFQAHLRGIDLLHQPFDVAYGSKVTMRAAGGDYGLFHSHDSPIPGGSNNHQVTCYGHKDNNNEWLFFKEYTKEKNDESTRIGSEKNSDPETAMTTATGTDSIEYIKNKSIVRLRHVNTEGMLTVSRNHKWLLNSKYYEVSGRKKDVSGKEKDEKNDNWQIEIVGPKNENVVKALTVTGNQLPAWGYEQSEVVCGFDGKEEHQIWNVENQWNQFLKNGNPKLAKQSFFKNFLYLNKAMARTNNGLVPDEDKIDDLASQPLDWPVLRYGIRMSGWEFHRHKYYMLVSFCGWDGFYIIFRFLLWEELCIYTTTFRHCTLQYCFWHCR
ncbi:Dolichyl-phosphate-mannose-protein mannosyltransferase 2 [Zancudomyces culisetae]|uniref:Dolichyl-phosphate-mannose--protein mannosyltransferase n=1 Tax=Zancudomyces culisetae TaxID=1213189 RepID=A0A1R1PMN4_ZANCU|nr:Dolichyl-phosphate-mannose-protein mannosyltransferase 2 [Zancudomyces culisetae]|eukprot:OMH82235.1 Dolichyl-phosphate-mannose-protein mannosyltransferase 2 [Zancudomyces culisetae]